MNKKAIKRHIQSKFEDFLKSIDDEKVRKLVEENSIITGGCITSMFQNEKINDYDLYFTNKATTLAVAHYYAAKTGSEVIDVDEMKEEDPGIFKYFETRGIYQKGRIALWKKAESQDLDISEEEVAEETPKFVYKYTGEEDPTGYIPMFITPSAITLSNKIQIILRFYGKADEIHKNFDFVHATNYFESKTKKIFVNQPALESIIAKELIYVGSRYPLATLFRMRKFINRGWSISAGQIIKIAWQISELNFKDNAILQDQLVGVDIAFMVPLVEALKSQLKEDPTKVDYQFVCELIDKFF